MSTIEQERLVATPEDTVLFMCRRADLRLTKTPRYPIRGASGQQVGETQGQVVAFRDGVLRVPKDGPVVLEDGRETDSGEVIAWLEKHRLFRDLEDGFWRVDPTAPLVSSDEIAALLEIVALYDEEKLVAFIEQERSGWAREDLLGTAETALERMRKIQAEGAAADGKKA